LAAHKVPFVSEGLSVIFRKTAKSGLNGGNRA
jgi:hypothetical protein